MTTVVVAAAIVSGRPPRVLAAQRAYPHSLAGLWELPGGKVDDGEDELAALRRECREELGVDVEPRCRLGADTPILGGDGILRVWWATPVVGEPQALEHSQVRWVTLEEVDGLLWLPSDAPVMAALRAEWPGLPCDA